MFHPRVRCGDGSGRWGAVLARSCLRPPASAREAGRQRACLESVGSSDSADGPRGSGLGSRIGTIMAIGIQIQRPSRRGSPNHDDSTYCTTGSVRGPSDLTSSRLICVSGEAWTGRDGARDRCARDPFLANVHWLTDGNRGSENFKLSCVCSLRDHSSRRRRR
jgi:hypothetical protein